MLLLRRTIFLVALALAGPVSVAVSATPAVRRTVSCTEIVDTPSFPYVGDRQQPYRLVLDAVSVPPAYAAQVVATHQRPWRYWHKAGLVVRADGQPVTLTVPSGWRTRVAITWGNGGQGGFNSLRIAGCAGKPHTGNAYVGGFYLSSSSACAPLVFTVAGRSATVRFGIGKRCG